MLTSVLPAQDYWVSYSKTIYASGKSGVKFKLKAYTRTDATDADAGLRLWIRFEGNGDSNFPDAINEMPIKSKDWKELFVEGVVGRDYNQIALGVMSAYNGKFFLDDMTLEIQDADGRWRNIYEDGFESETQSRDWVQGMTKDLGKNEFFKQQISSDLSRSGKHCLLISGTNVPNYGTNTSVGRYSRVNGIDLYYESYGTGKPLVILHGNGGSIATAGQHLPHFAQRYKVIAVDSRAQGKSIDNDTELTYELMASDINALLDELQIDSALIWGHSDGAILALVLALNHPKKVKKVVAFAANVLPDTIGIEQPIFRHIQKTISTTSNRKQKQLYTLMYKHPNINPSRLRQIRADILVMSGDRDFVPLSHTLDIFRNIPNSNLCVIPGATHAAAWEKPKLFQELVIDFLEKPIAKPNTADWFK
ncbi:MAG: alpha/beta hydrolase [Cyclobacteriaceae bacterium]|nr:alpha/beta hydrolase [Cyclobacteriaceae bacterium]